MSVTETYRIDNELDTTKKLNIMADLNLYNGKFSSLNSIVATANGRSLFTGNLMGNGINGTFTGDAENPNSEIMTEVEKFVNSVKAEASELSSFASDNA